MFAKGVSMDEMTYRFGRTEGAVMAKLEELGLADNPNRPHWTRRPKPLYFKEDNTHSHKQKRRDNRLRNLPDRVGFLWSDSEECLLIREFRAKISVDEMCKVHKRCRGGIISRMKHLELIQ